MGGGGRGGEECAKGKLLLKTYVDPFALLTNNLISYVLGVRIWKSTLKHSILLRIIFSADEEVLTVNETNDEIQPLTTFDL